jgi:tRNA G18 (ribose-2'-O)-methylase SpoU
MVNYKKINKEILSNHYNVRDEYKNNTLQENVNICKADRLPFSVGMINVTGELNVGMALRSASLLGAENFYIFGRKKFDARSTVGAENYINVVQYVFDDPINSDEDIYQKVVDLYLEKHDIVLCEHGGAQLGTFSWAKLIEDSHGFMVDGTLIKAKDYSKYTPLFLFGSESFGTPKCLLENHSFIKVSIPQRGVLRSFNVSAAMNLIVWDYIKETHL